MTRPPRAQLEAAAAELGLAPRELELVADGIRGAVYRLVDAEGTAHALIVPADPDRPARDERGLALARTTSLPVPARITAATTQALGPVALRPWLDGEPAARSIARFREGEPVELRRRGELLAALAGSRPEVPAGQPAWLDEVARDAQALARAGLELGGRGPEAWRRIKGAGFEPAPPCVVHGDLVLAHILVERHAVTGVIDWELARAGDPVLDWAPLASDDVRSIRCVAEGYGLERARALFASGASRRRLAAYALGRCLRALAAVARTGRRDDRAGQAVRRLATTLDRLLARDLDVALARALFADAEPPAPTRRALDPATRFAGPVVDHWRERLHRLRAEHRAPAAPPGGPPAGIDVDALLGGATGFFAHHWDARPAILTLPGALPACDWIDVVREAALALAGTDRALTVDAHGRRVLGPGELEPIAEQAARRLLVLQDLHAVQPVIARLRDAFAAYFGCPVTTGCYLNGAGAPGFREHHDAHHVFALQLAGTKRWHLGPPIVAHAWRRYDLADRGETGALEPHEVRAGELLYVPLGWRHHAEPCSELSVHVTFGVHVPRVLDVAEAILARAGALDPRLRAPLAPVPGPRGVVWRGALDRALLDDALAVAATPARAAVELAGCRVAAAVPLPDVAGAWPVEDGAFVPAALASGRAELAALAARLVELDGVASVHLRGSALEGDPPDRSFDLDLVIVTGAAPDESLRAACAELARGVELGAPVDLRLVELAAVRDGTAPPSLRLVLAVRSERLAGPPIWADPPRIPADAGFAAELRAEIAALWGPSVRRAGVEGFPPVATRWLQKRALRLLGVLGVERLGVFTRHPLGCAALAHVLAPARAALAETVADELIAGASGMGPAIRAIELGAALLGGE